MIRKLCQPVRARIKLAGLRHEMADISGGQAADKKQRICGLFCQLGRGLWPACHQHKTNRAVSFETTLLLIMANGL